MMLATGTKLGPYETFAPLGAGGMGEAYKTSADSETAVGLVENEEPE
jgi:hypothetical protein